MAERDISSEVRRRHLDLVIRYFEGCKDILSKVRNMIDDFCLSISVFFLYSEWCQESRKLESERLTLYVAHIRLATNGHPVMFVQKQKSILYIDLHQQEKGFP